jgi:hypothetical protein
VGTSLNEGAFSVTVTNRGVGPAEVQRVRVLVDGKPAVDWLDMEAMLRGRRRFFESSSFDEIAGQVVNPGLTIESFKVSDRAEALALFAESSRVAIEICYCSSLGDCWLERMPTPFEPPTTDAIDGCKPDANPFRAAGPETLAEMRAVIARVSAGGDAGAPDAH